MSHFVTLLYLSVTRLGTITFYQLQLQLQLHVLLARAIIITITITRIFGLFNYNYNYNFTHFWFVQLQLLLQLRKVIVIYNCICNCTQPCSPHTYAFLNVNKRKICIIIAYMKFQFYPIRWLGVAVLEYVNSIARI